MDRAPPGWLRRNFVFGPATLTTGCRPIVFVTTPPQPASKARMMLVSDSVGGADASRNGFSKRRPVNVDASVPMRFLRENQADLPPSRAALRRASPKPWQRREGASTDDQSRRSDH